MSQQSIPENTDIQSDIGVLQNKGALFVLMAIAMTDKDGLTFSEVREKTGLSTGTTQRRLNELCEKNWLRREAELNDQGRAVKRYYISDETANMWDAIKELGRTLLS